MKRTDTPALARRTALMLPLAALSGCGMFDGWFGATKPKLPGKRYDVMPPDEVRAEGDAAAG